jgi:hypothetical protein
MNRFSVAAEKLIEDSNMSKDLSRRKFLERIGVGTAAGMSLALLNDVAEAHATTSTPLPRRALGLSVAEAGS